MNSMKVLLFEFGMDAAKWLNPATHIVGLAICVWGYRVCRKPAYLMLGAYFSLLICSLAFSSAFDRAALGRRRSRSQLSPQMQQQYEQDLRTLYQKYFPTPAPAEVRFYIPLAPVASIFLVSGVWLLAHREKSTATASERHAE